MVLGMAQAGFHDESPPIQVAVISSSFYDLVANVCPRSHILTLNRWQCEIEIDLDHGTRVDGERGFLFFDEDSSNPSTYVAMLDLASCQLFVFHNGAAFCQIDLTKADAAIRNARRATSLKRKTMLS